MKLFQLIGIKSRNRKRFSINYIIICNIYFSIKKGHFDIKDKEHTWNKIYFLERNIYYWLYVMDHCLNMGYWPQ